MKIEIIDIEFSICKVEDFSAINIEDEFFFVSKTDEEISLVCETKSVPANILVRDEGWRAFRIQGTLDFSLVGILAKISTLLAENGISIFAISTYNTDYILTKSEHFNNAIEILKAKNYMMI